MADGSCGLTHRGLPSAGRVSLLRSTLCISWEAPAKPKSRSYNHEDNLSTSLSPHSYFLGSLSKEVTYKLPRTLTRAARPPMETGLGFCLSSYKTDFKSTATMAQKVRCLLREHEGLSLILRTHVKKAGNGAEVMAGPFRAPTTLSEDPGLVLSTYRVTTSICDSSSRDPVPSCGPQGYCRHWCTCTH